MNIGLVYRTVRNLKLKQIVWQVLNRIRKKSLRHIAIDSHLIETKFNNYILKSISRQDVGGFTFLNIYDTPINWSETSHGMLWAYNFNYMDYLLQPNVPKDEALILIENFIDELPTNKVGLDPYPIALRGINWIKWMSGNANDLHISTRNGINNSLYSQYKLLESKVEWHLMGNHLLEDAFSLFIASLYFNNIRFYRKSTKILRKQLKEQILDDGTHYEQSPMYHCILLDRLLDCYNLSLSNPIFKDQSGITETIKEKAIRMLGHLESIIYKDGSIPLLNDSALKIAPAPSEIFAYARRLNLDWTAIPLSDSGYRRFNTGRVEGIIDIGDIKASYQPGHTHADTFNYELRIDGEPFIIDTGISTYEKNQRRQYERSTSAHNTVTIDNKDSSEVWGGFRVADRASVEVLEDSDLVIKASLKGFGGKLEHTREFHLYEGLDVIDEISKGHHGISRIHFAPGIRVKVQGNHVITDKAVIVINGAENIVLADEMAATEYNSLQPISKVEIHFTDRMEYNIII